MSWEKERPLPIEASHRGAGEVLGRPPSQQAVGAPPVSIFYSVFAPVQEQPAEYQERGKRLSSVSVTRGRRPEPSLPGLAWVTGLTCTAEGVSCVVPGWHPHPRARVGCYFCCGNSGTCTQRPRRISIPSPLALWAISIAVLNLDFIF